MQAPSPILFLQDWLNSYSISKLITLGQQLPPVLNERQNRERCRVTHLLSHAYLSLDEDLPQAVVISDYLEKLPVEEGRKLLADIRNHLIPHVLLFIDHSKCTQWEFSFLIGLGFKRLMEFKQDARNLCCYGYDIDSYNPRRTWNNSDHWANPQLFGKYWW